MVQFHIGDTLGVRGKLSFVRGVLTQAPLQSDRCICRAAGACSKDGGPSTWHPYAKPSESQSCPYPGPLEPFVLNDARSAAPPYGYGPPAAQSPVSGTQVELLRSLLVSKLPKRSQRLWITAMAGISALSALSALVCISLVLEAAGHAFLTVPHSKNNGYAASYALPKSEYYTTASWWLDRAFFEGDPKKTPWLKPGHFSWKDARDLYPDAVQTFHPCGCYNPHGVEACAGVSA